MKSRSNLDNGDNGILNVAWKAERSIRKAPQIPDQIQRGETKISDWNDVNHFELTTHDP